MEVNCIQILLIDVTLDLKHADKKRKPEYMAHRQLKGQGLGVLKGLSLP